MFIPPGEVIHESLATSYVLVDALVADLCEGGFSGVVEVVLRDTDSFIVISSGNVASVVETRGDQEATNSPSPLSYTRTTIEHLAERSRLERGRLSIYGYSADTASAVAGCINAQPLYVGLSTEFTDLEKMMAKLVRERDREWFIELNTESGAAALIHMRDAQCRVIGSTGDSDSSPLDPAANVALAKLIDECNRAGGTFDVYFTQAAGETGARAEHTSVEPSPAPSSVVAAIVNEEPVEPHLASFQHDVSGSMLSNDLLTDAIGEARLPDYAAPGPEHEERPLSLKSVGVAAATTQSGFAAPEEDSSLDSIGDSIGDLIGPKAGDLSIIWDELPPVAADAEAMTETKRLMGEIARAIEEAAQAVGRPDSFSMCLRAGQLKIADRFPFLDPFAGEFEYLAGEIVFVGHAPAEEFVVGLTEALKLAIEAVTRSTAYADRFRSYVTEDLQKLFARERAEFERFGLDPVIEQLLTDDR